MQLSIIVAAVAASVPFTSASPISGRQLPGLNLVAKGIGKLYFGTATDNLNETEWTDQKYMSILDEPYQFGQLTPANAMKWEYTEPGRNDFNYSGGDQLVQHAEQYGDLVRCHNLVWYNQLPDWLTSGTWDNATLISIMENHITHLVTHWAPHCYCWDVVNEALNDDGTYREDIFYDTIGPAYIPIAFAAAEKAARAAGHPEIKLYYNDYNIEYPGVKSTAAQNIVASLQSQGIRIDGVGLQSHFIVGETPSESEQQSNMDAFTSLGVEVAITELDIRFTSLPYNATGQAQQASDYEGTVAACKNVDGCVGITLWDFSDKYSWIPSTFTGEGGACPWDEHNSVKPVVYKGIIEGLTTGE